MEFKYTEGEYKVERYPKTNDRSLQAWNAGDLLILDYLNKKETNLGAIAIYNDRFGFLSVNLNKLSPQTIIDHKSQQKALLHNCTKNKIDYNKNLLKNPLQKLDKTLDLVCIKIPKSLDHFDLYLDQVIQNIKPDGKVVCAFMTKHFTPQMLKIGQKYFESVEQSLAVKKARLMILKGPKESPKVALKKEIKSEEIAQLNQYLGVFSGQKVDNATQFLIQNMDLSHPVGPVLDLGSGNGILAKIIRQKNKDCEIHLLDDFWLAVESSKLNLSEEKTHFHWQNDLTLFDNDYFDYVISNPPFHFGHENNIVITLNLFNGVKRILKPNGIFQVVANKHLNYYTHLEKIFRDVEVVIENNKFVIYDCLA